MRPRRTLTAAAIRNEAHGVRCDGIRSWAHNPKFAVGRCPEHGPSLAANLVTHVRVFHTDGLGSLRARYYDPASGRFMSRDPVMGTVRVPLSLNRYTYAANDPTHAVDPSGLLTYFVGGIGGPGNAAYVPFVEALRGGPTDLGDVRPPVPAFDTAYLTNLSTVLGEAALNAADPLLDQDALRLASQIKRDPALFNVRLGYEQLNLIGYSGGATVAFDTAVILAGYGIYINNIVTMGGFVLRGKPGNVDHWTEIIGSKDPIGLGVSHFPGNAPDRLVVEQGVVHQTGRGAPTYITGNGLTQTLDASHSAGLQ